MISVILVARNEPEDRLERLMHALAGQQDVEPFEIVVAAPIADHPSYAVFVPSGAVASMVCVDNPGGERSPGLNRAIRAARGDVVVRVDARSVPPSDYVAKCCTRLTDSPEVGVVGAIQWVRPASDGVWARGVARALGNPWMLGNAAYRRADGGGPSDTVYLGAFRRAELLALGGYDERLDANEDFDLCRRYLDAGLEVWVEPGMAVPYEARSTPAAAVGQYFAFGRAKTRFWRTTGRRPGSRQLVAIGGAVAGVAVLGAAVISGKPAVVGGAIAAALTGAVVVDHLAEPGERDVRVRGAAVLTNGLVIAAWLTGMAREGLGSADSVR